MIGRNVETRKKVVVSKLLDGAANTLKLAANSPMMLNRELGAKGTIYAWIGRDRKHVWVNHGSGKCAAYLAEELEFTS